MQRDFLPCSVSGCDRPSHARSLCDRHYARCRRHGDPTGGSDGTEHGVPRKFLEEVVLAHSGPGCLAWPYSLSSTGYGVIWHDGRMQRVSRLVCERLHGPSPTPTHEAAHSCGRGHLACVSPAHLRWATHVANKADELIHGTRNRGERHGISKLTSDDVRAIRRLAPNTKHAEVATMFDVHPGTIGKVLRGEAWGWLR